MSWYLEALMKYVDFSGRARRMEYWMFTLVNTLVAVGLSVVGAMLGEPGGALASLLLLAYSLAVLVPGLAVAVRRLHDTGRSGWWMLIGLVPLVGGIVLLVFLVQEGERSDNAFGADPKGGRLAWAH